MPKWNERDRLAELEERRRKAAEDVEKARHALRGKCADLIRALPLERLAEHDLREIVAQAIRAGGGAAIIALKALPNAGGDAAAGPRQPARPSRSKTPRSNAGEEPQPSLGNATDPVTGP